MIGMLINTWVYVYASVFEYWISVEMHLYVELKCMTTIKVRSLKVLMHWRYYKVVNVINWVNCVIPGCVLSDLWVLLIEEYESMWVHLTERKYRIIKYMIKPKEEWRKSEQVGKIENEW